MEKDNLLVNGESQPIPEPAKKSSFSRRQWTVFIFICIVNVFEAMAGSLQGPFFPPEAEKKGATATVYGLIFGVFELVNFIFCPIYGKYIRYTGPKFMFVAGNLVLATSCILFGFLPEVRSGTPFIASAFVIRIVMALGQSAYFTSSYAITAHEFPERLATTFAMLETAYGVGQAIGPTVGGFLYEFGGFILPFTTVGGFLFMATIFMTVLFPHIGQSYDEPRGLLRLLRIPSVLISCYGVFAVSFGVGFTGAFLEPHLRQFVLSPIAVGVVFVTTGAVYAVTAVFWGYIAEKGVDPKLMCGYGAIVTIASFLLIGPAPFLPWVTHLWMVIVALVLQGIGMGGQYVATFLDSSNAAKQNGFPENADTYGLVAGVWISGTALGHFAGPSLCGVLTDSFGFRNSSQVTVVINIIVAILNFGYFACEKRRESTYDKLTDR